MRFFHLTALTLGLLVACRSTSNEHLRIQARADDAVIAPGDTVTVVDELRPEATLASARIASDGRMDVPGLGLIEVAGFTRRGLESKLTERFRGIHGQTDVAVDILPPDNSYYVYGEVARSGRFGMSDGCTAYEAVMGAEPDTSIADLSSVRLVRGELAEEQIVHVNIRRMTRGDVTFNVTLQDGDILYVPPTAVGRLVSPVLSRPKPSEDPEVRRLRVEAPQSDE